MVRTVADLKKRQEAASLRLDADTAKPPPKGFETVEKTINDKRLLIDTELKKKLSPETCGEAEKQLDELEKLVREAAEELVDLGGDASAVIAAFGGDENAMQKADDAFGGRPALRAACKAFKTPQAVADLATGLGGGDLKKGAATLTALQTAFKPAEIEALVKDLGADRLAALLAAAGNDARALADAQDALGTAGLAALAPKAADAAVPFTVIAELGGAPALKKLCAETGLGAKPKALAAMLTKGCGGDAKKLAAMMAQFASDGDRAELKNVIERGGMGDAPDCLGELMADGCDGRPAALKDLIATLGKSDDGLDGLKRLLTTGGLAGRKGQNDVVEIDPKCFSKLLKFGAGDTKQNDGADDGKRSAALTALCEKMGNDDCTRLSKLLLAGGLGPEPDVLGHMIGLGCEGDPDKVKDLATKLDDPTTQGKLKTLLQKGGFGKTDSTGNAVDIDPKCLASLLKPGCEGKPDTLKTLIDGLDEPACVNLAKVMTKGGLGKASDALGDLVGEGCKGRPAALKAFGTSFAVSDDRQEGLQRLLTKGGLEGKKDGTGNVQIDTKCLAGLLKFTAGETKANDPADDSKRSDKLAELCAKLTETDCGHLSKTLIDGGMGTEPEVLGHMAGIGCGSDPDKAKVLVEKLDDPTTLPKLKSLLKKGKFGTKDDTGTDTDTDPKCLAQMLNLGCEGKAADLKSLIDKLDDTDCGNLAKVMKEGGMGKRPKVLGNTYKFGCLKDPHDPASDKEPDNLKKLATAFGTDPAAAKMKSLLEDGGLGDEANHPEWMGKVIRDGFTERHYVPAPAPPAPPPARAAPGKPSGKVQDPAKLVNLHDAFAGQMPKLKTMMNALGTMPPRCGETDEPGKALQNVCNPNKPGHGVPIAGLQNFYDTLDARSGGPGVGGAMGGGGPTIGIAVPGGFPPAPSLTGVELLQEAASMQREPVVAPAVTLNGYDTDMSHVMVRHNRTTQSRALNGDNNTSMLPKNIKEEDVRAIIRACIADSSLGKAKPSQIPPAPVHNPPTLQSDLKNNQRQYLNVTDGNIVGTIGYKWQGGRVKVGQFYPTGGGNSVTINARDLAAIKTALGMP